MKLFFAGCARDCADALVANVKALVTIENTPWCDELRIYIAENSSRDNTRDVIANLALQDKRIIPVLLEDLDEKFPVRESRIAFCRDRLLDEICKAQSNGLYVPIDLDSGIASSLDINEFMQACQLVESGKCTGIFPCSYPYYYDIHALREAEWCPESCWKEVQNAGVRSNLWSLIVNLRYVALRQKTHESLRRQGLKPVESAFGGVGIYSLREVKGSGASYSSPDLENDQHQLCEHVIFNSHLHNLFINTEWAVAAPSEHIQFRLLPRHKKLTMIIQAGLADMKLIAFAVAGRIKRSVVRHIVS
jgi:hypothetical protein